MTLLPSHRIAAVALALLFATAWARSLACAQNTSPRTRAHPKDLSPALQRQLSDTLSDEVAKFSGVEEENRENGKTYVDLLPQFEYLPNYGSHGKVIVSAKVGGAEYAPGKGSSRGQATGRLKYLVFTYALVDGKWVEIQKPRWEEQDLGTAAGEKITAGTARADKLRAQRAEAAAARAKAAASPQSPTPAPTGACSLGSC